MTRRDILVRASEIMREIYDQTPETASDEVIRAASVRALLSLSMILKEMDPDEWNEQ